MARRLATAAATLALALAAAPAADAGVLTASAPSCEAQTLSHPFSPWIDVFAYTLAPGGAAERSSGWKLSNGASVVPGNEPWKVHGAADSSSLSLPPGSSATTGTMCVGLEHPSLRFFTRSNKGLLSLSALRVEALYEDAAGNTRALPLLGVGTPSTSWEATLPMVMVANFLPLLPGQYTPMAFRFTPLGSATWQIDDVYVDPYRRN